MKRKAGDGGRMKGKAGGVGKINHEKTKHAVTPTVSTSLLRFKVDKHVSLGPFSNFN